MLLAHLDLVDRVVGSIARRNALDTNEMEEFRSWVRERLLEGDCAILRKFGGRSSLATYLAVVLTNLFSDYRNLHWGRWRSSAAATRLGPLAVRLERMVYRDGCPVGEAIETIRSSQDTSTSKELSRLFAQLPTRTPAREVGLEAAEGVVGEAADWTSERERTLRHTQSILDGLLQGLGPEDLVVVRMRYWEEASVADIARTLRIDQKRLYRRLESIQARLREGLEGAGVGREQVAMLLNPEAAA